MILINNMFDRRLIFIFIKLQKGRELQLEYSQSRHETIGDIFFFIISLRSFRGCLYFAEHTLHLAEYVNKALNSATRLDILKSVSICFKPLF